ncbi:MAG: ABC transporter permease [Defluviitaleaceae bacterium]|nr:ABC transporter permease [Defluviitaleaceae bacterium]
MRNIWMLARANLRKNKGQTFGMILLVLLAVMFLNIGIVMYFGVGDFFDTRAEGLNAPHFITLQSKTPPSNAQLDFIRQYPGVVAVESESVLVGLADVHGMDMPFSGVVIITSGDVSRQMNPLTTIADTLPLENDAAYLPHSLFLHLGYNIGDRLSINFTGETLYFTVAGSTEEIVLDGMVDMIWRIQISNEKFAQLQIQFPQTNFTMLSARMENKDDTILLSTAYMMTFLWTEYKDLTMLGTAAIIIPYTIELARSGRTFIPTIIAAIITAFAFILLIVGMVVTRFRIANSIEEGMVNVGTLKAMGYRNYQIIASIIVQFSFVVLIGGLMGVVLSGVLLPVLTQIFEPMLGLPWNPGFNAGVMLFSLMAVLLIVLLFSLISAWRVHKLYPIAALRGGIATHNFKKNPMPLDKSRGPLIFQLALKNLIQSKKQFGMLTLIIAGVTLASVTGITIHYNLNVNMDTFVPLIGGELAVSDIIVSITDTEEGPGFTDRMQAHPDVDQIFGFETSLIFVEGVTVMNEVFEDFSHLLGHSLVDGRFPRHDNEIALGENALYAIGKNMGDWVVVESGGNAEEFLVTGIIQQFQFNGIISMMNLQALQRLRPNAALQSFVVVLAQGTDETLFTTVIREAESNLILEAIPFAAMVAEGLDTMGAMFTIVTIVILSAVAGVVIMVLFLVIKTTILRKRRELGIQKALGFTTLRLMNQTAINLTPAIFLGVIIGALGGYLTFNPLFTALSSGMGISQANFIIPIDWTLFICVAVLLLAYVVSMLISWRIRKISAYALVTEG